MNGRMDSYGLNDQLVERQKSENDPKKCFLSVKNNFFTKNFFLPCNCCSLLYQYFLFSGKNKQKIRKIIINPEKF